MYVLVGGVVLAMLFMIASSTHAADDEGIRACIAFKDALETFTDTGYLPGLRSRLKSVAAQGARSTDPYLQNATAQLARARDDEMVTWMRVVTRVCVDRTLSVGTVVFQAPPVPPEPQPLAPAAPPPGGMYGRLSDNLRRLTEHYRELAAAVREANRALAPQTPPPPPPLPPPAQPLTSPPATTTKTPSAVRQFTPAEAEAMTKRATEQSGSTKCETKVYGGGAAVTVCE